MNYVHAYIDSFRPAANSSTCLQLHWCHLSGAVDGLIDWLADWLTDVPSDRVRAEASDIRGERATAGRPSAATSSNPPSRGIYLRRRVARLAPPYGELATHPAIHSSTRSSMCGSTRSIYASRGLEALQRASE
eukprot:GHVU01020338.1.p2 GENE.GHVU01020338.1~~GHVU01020338.1.p2  ORF type:complete len:133 (+),score=5.73 GHVU01020338.1:761-1159(+)